MSPVEMCEQRRGRATRISAIPVLRDGEWTIAATCDWRLSANLVRARLAL